jgi:hypothetical protein
MDHEQAEYQRQREATLAVMLSGLALGGFLVFLALISGGFFIWVYLIVVGMAALGYVNYVLWGRSMTEATAGEREEEEVRARLEEEGWPDADPRQPRHD